MDEKIIITELEYYNHLDSIQKTLHESKGLEIKKLLDDNHFDFLQTKLGIRVSCFMVWDVTDNKYVLYQNDLIDSKGTFYPHIPFHINKNDDYEGIIDLAFIADRYPEYRNEVSPFPEFHRFFQKSESKNLNASEKEVWNREQKTMHEFWNSNYKPKKRNSTFEIFYRPTGEVLFFLYAWRYLVKYYLKYSPDKKIESFDDFYFDKCEINYEHTDDWFINTTGFDFDKLFGDSWQDYMKKYKRISEDITINENDKKVKREELRDSFVKSNKAYEEFKDYEFDKNPFDFVNKEWVSLGIDIDYSDTHNLSLKLLLEYTIKVSNYSCSDKEDEKQRKEALSNLKHFITQIKQNNLNYESKHIIHRSLAFIFYNLFNVKGLTIIEAFKEKFLKSIRFPVFAYFLEFLFDKKHAPKEHLVFPIWFSNEIMKDDRSRDVADERSRYVAYVLLSMEPVWSFTNSFEKFKNTTSSVQNTLQKININRIKSFYRIIHNSLIEESFYVRIIQKRLLKPATKAAVSQVMARNMSHNIGSHVVPYFVSKYFESKRIQELHFFEKSNPGQEAQKITFEVNRYNRYIQERMELIATVSTTFPFYLKTEATVEEIFKEFKENEIIFKGIVDDSLKIEFDENYPEQQFHLPGGQIGKQLMFSIIEGIVRNCKKHSSARDNKYIDICFKISDYNEDYYKLEIIDKIGAYNPKRDLETLNRIRKHLYSSILDKNELRQGGWGILELKIAAALLIGVPLEYIDLFQKDNEPVTIDNVNYPPIIEVGFYDANLNPVGDDVTEAKMKNIGYSILVLKPKLYFVDNEESFKMISHLTDVSTIVKKDCFSIYETSDFYFGDVSQSVQSNYRLFYNFDNTDLNKDNFKKSVWEKWIQSKYPDYKEIAFDKVGEETKNFNSYDKFVFDNHGKWLKKEMEADSNFLETFVPKFYQPYNAKSSLAKMLQFEDEIMANKLKEAIAISVSVFDERIQSEIKGKEHEEIPGVGLGFIFGKMGVFIPDYSAKEDITNLQYYIDKEADTKIEFDKHPLLNIIKERFVNHKDKFVLIHHTLFEKIAKEVCDNGSNSQASLDNVYKTIYTSFNLLNQQLIIISGLGLPSNLPFDCYFLNLVTVQNLLVVMKSKFHLVQALHSLRPIRNIKNKI